MSFSLIRVRYPVIARKKRTSISQWETNFCSFSGWHSAERPVWHTRTHQSKGHPNLCQDSIKESHHDRNSRKLAVLWRQRAFASSAAVRRESRTRERTNDSCVSNDRTLSANQNSICRSDARTCEKGAIFCLTASPVYASRVGIYVGHKKWLQK